MLDLPALARCRGRRRIFWLEARDVGDSRAAVLLVCQKAFGQEVALWRSSARTAERSRAALSGSSLLELLGFPVE